MNSELISTKFGDVEFKIVGKGSPILFLHGGHSNCYETLSHKGINLDDFQLITPSRPGYGRTPLGDNKTPKKAAFLLNELLNYLKIEKVIVFGISAGGLTAIEMASRFPNRVKKLILASAVSKKWLSKSSATYKAARIMFNPRVEGITWKMLNTFSSLFPKFIAGNFHSQFSNIPIGKIDNNDAKELIGILKLFRSKTGFIVDIDQVIEEGVIDNIQCPTLVLHSKNDNSVPFEHGLYSQSSIRNSNLIALENEWGHLFWIGKDYGIALKAIVDFIAQT